MQQLKLGITTAALFLACIATAQNNSSSDPRIATLQQTDPAKLVADGEPYAAEWIMIAEKDISWKRRVLRTIDLNASENQMLNKLGAPNTSLATVLVKGTQEGRFKAYNDQRFTTELTSGQIKTLTSGLNTKTCFKLRIKEDWLYLPKENKLIVRVIGIAPVRQIEAANGDVSEETVCWVYYPYTREYLREQTIGDGKTANMQHLDQAIQNREFASTVDQASPIPKQ